MFTSFWPKLEKIFAKKKKTFSFFSTAVYNQLDRDQLDVRNHKQWPIPLTNTLFHT